MSALETSITLGDVFSVVEAKRVPLAPELAGYLTLEVADGAQASSGDVDPRTVYISEEGTVALVRPKSGRESGDAETSVRGFLAKLLDASGSATPALTAAARRKPGAGLPALVQELEAALIPVNRAAGRRALARLAREVKRVTLGVGRNASSPPISRPPISRPATGLAARPVVPPAPPVPRIESPDDIMSGPDAPPGPRASFSDEPATANRMQVLAELALQMNAPELLGEPSSQAQAPRAPKPAVPEVGLTPPPLPVAPGAPPERPKAREPAREAALPKAGAPRLAPPAPRGLTPPPAKAGAGAPVRDAVGSVPDSTLFGRDEVDSLLASFEVSNAGEKQVRSDLKAIAGLDPTPGPPDATTLADLTRDIGKDLPKQIDKPSAPMPASDGVEDLLALADASVPLRSLDAPILPPASVSSSSLAPSSPSEPLPPAPPPPLGGVAATPPLAPITGRREHGHGREPGAPVLPSADTPAPPQVAARAPTPPAKLDPPPPAASASSKREKLPPPPASTARRSRDAAFEPVKTKRRKRSAFGFLLPLFVGVAVLAAGAAVWTWRPALFTAARRRPPETPTAPPAPAPPRCKLSLVVTDVTPNAEILLRVGQSPLDAERMPVGAHLEFVATAEGYAPRRAIVRADATWDKGPDGKPRVDVPIQLDPSKGKAGSVDPWPPSEPDDKTHASPEPGTVHIVANVRGAEVWLLAGFGPEARIEQLRCDGDMDLLVAGAPQLRKRLHVSEKDIEAQAPDALGNRVVTVSAK